MDLTKLREAQQATRAIDKLRADGWEVTAHDQGTRDAHWICKPPGAHPTIVRLVSQLSRYAFGAAGDSSTSTTKQAPDGAVHRGRAKNTVGKGA